MLENASPDAAGPLWFCLTLWPPWPKPTAMSSLSLVPQHRKKTYSSWISSTDTPEKFFHLYFLVVLPRDRTTDFAFVIKHLLGTCFPPVRSRTICHHLLELHIFLVDNHHKLSRVWNTFIINSRPYSKLCELCSAMEYKGLLWTAWTFGIHRECEVPG